MNEKNLLNLMNSLSIEEKIGQLIQITPDFFDSEGEVTGPPTGLINPPETLIFC